jgi:hypothetical protein
MIPNMRSPQQRRHRNLSHIRLIGARLTSLRSAIRCQAAGWSNGEATLS